MTTQVFVASTAFGLTTVIAALDDGAFPAADRRVLLLSNNALTPETANRIEDVGGLSALLHRFDAVYDYNEAIAPQHPSLWRPRAADLPLIERYLTALWSLTDQVHLVVESIQVSPALTLCRIFPDARIDVYADGLMSYGPTRNRLPALVASRIERLLHLDLVPGVSPVLLTEFAVPPHIISTDAFRKAVAALDPAPLIVSSAGPREVAVLLGQYLSALGIVTLAEETELHLEMVRAAAAAGFSSAIFKPHPTAPLVLAEPLVVEAARLGVSLVVYDSPELVEGWFRSGSVGCVIGCFSTALVTAAVCYDLPAARVGTDLMLDRLSPFQNSNRIPVTIVDATLPHVLELDLSATAEASGVRRRPVADLDRLLKAVSYCMQPRRYPELRADAERLLSAWWEDVRPYFKRRRLSLLDLPGRLPQSRYRLIVPQPIRAAARRILGPALCEHLAKVTRGPDPWA